MSEMTCPLCGQEMAAIETYAGRGELYCDHCDLTIGGNEAKTPDELMALLEQRTCHFNVVINQDPSRRGRGNICECDKCGYQCARGFIEDERFKYCPNCGKRIKEEAE